MYQDSIFGGPKSGGSFPPSPPSPVLVGNTIFVSSKGSASGVREDLVYHFNSIDQAILAAQDNDLIIVYPGDYFLSIILTNTKTLNVYCYPGVRIFNKDDYFLRVEFDFALNWMGDADFVAQNTFVYGFVFQSNIQCNFECKNVSLNGDCYGFILNTSNIYINVKGTISGTGTALPMMEISSQNVDSLINHTTIINVNKVTNNNSDTNFINIDGNYLIAITRNVDKSTYIELNINVIEAICPGPLIKFLTIGTININVGLLKNLNNDVSIETIFGQYYGSAIRGISNGQNANINVKANIICSGATWGIEAISFDNNANPGSYFGDGTGQITYDCIVESEGPYAYFLGGRNKDKIIVNGHVNFSGETIPVRIGWWNDGDEWNQLYELRVEWNANIYCSSECIAIYFQSSHKDPSLANKLILNSKIIQPDVENYSISSDREESIVIQSLVASLPPNPDLINCIASSPIIDPNIF